MSDRASGARPLSRFDMAQARWETLDEIAPSSAAISCILIHVGYVAEAAQFYCGAMPAALVIFPYLSISAFMMALPFTVAITSALCA